MNMMNALELRCLFGLTKSTLNLLPVMTSQQNFRRNSHTDLKVPDFSEYRTKYSENPVQNTKDHADDRKVYSYIATYGVGLASLYGAKAIVRDLLSYEAPSADVLALSTIEINLKDIPMGKNLTFKWREKPLFVRHRTQDQIQVERSVDLG